MASTQATRAVNSLGWEVQAFNRLTGWTAMSGPYPTQEEAHAAMARMGLLGSGNFRVYEALDHPSIPRKDS